MRNRHMIMKNRFFAAVMVACTFCGCQEREKEAPAAPERTVRFHVRSIETKSAFGTPDGKVRLRVAEARPFVSGVIPVAGSLSAA